MQIGSGTDIGCIRTHNEDAYAILKQETAMYIFVADGMGGHKSGDIASQLAVSTLTACLEGQRASTKLFRESIEIANASIFAKAKEDKSTDGMGTTLVSAMIEKNEITIANVGDSRAYHYKARTRELCQITTDHSLVQEMISCGELDKKSAKTFPYQNIITRALGCDEKVSIDFFEIEWENNDCLLLCTDGLTRYIDERILRKKLAQPKAMQALCDELLNMAKHAGGRDNITVVLVQNTQGGDCFE